VPSNPSPKPMHAHRLSPVKGNVLPELGELCEGVELCDELGLELTELGADWDSVGELDGVVLVVDVLVLALLLLLLELLLW
jgi:hypothetical protein